MRDLKSNNPELEVQILANISHKPQQMIFSRRFIVRLCLFAISGLQFKEKFKTLSSDEQSSTQSLKKLDKNNPKNTSVRSNPTPSPSPTPEKPDVGTGRGSTPNRKPDESA